MAMVGIGEERIGVDVPGTGPPSLDIWSRWRGLSLATGIERLGCMIPDDGVDQTCFSVIVGDDRCPHRAAGRRKKRAERPVRGCGATGRAWRRKAGNRSPVRGHPSTPRIDRSAKGRRGDRPVAISLRRPKRESVSRAARYSRGSRSRIRKSDALDLGCIGG